MHVGSVRWTSLVVRSRIAGRDASDRHLRQAAIADGILRLSVDALTLGSGSASRSTLRGHALIARFR
jgi:hypothetical protein